MTKRAPNPPWKHIEGVDRKYTERLERMRNRRAAIVARDSIKPVVVTETMFEPVAE